MKDNGSPPPEFDFDEDHTYFLVRLSVHPEAGKITREMMGAESRPESRPELRPESGLEHRIMDMLQESPKSKSEIAAALGHKSVSGAVKRAVSRLLSKGLIEYTIPEKPQSRLQKYRLTRGINQP